MTLERREFLYVSAAPFLRSIQTSNPFSLGVASGDPTGHSVVLWTRLLPAPTEPVAVFWELASDDAMRRVVQHGETVARPERAHSIHVDVEGLSPGRPYWYRFRTRHAESRVGRTKTLPTGRARFVTASCQHYEQGYFVAYRHMIEDDPDFVVHLGDYIYDVSFGPGVRKHETSKTPQTVEDYRLRHALYKTDPFLQEAHASLPFFVVPDNHDVLEYDDPQQASRKAAGLQVWYEHMPVRASSLRRTIDVGNLARIYLLDTRQFRDNQDVCREGMDPSYGFGIYRPQCETLQHDERSMLGSDQESWLAKRMRDSQATWNVVATTVPFAPFVLDHAGDPFVYYGSWSAYPRNRERVLDAVLAAELSNPIFVSGDVHSHWVSEIRREKLIAPEFTTTSISSGWPAPLDEPVQKSLSGNPHVRFYDGNHRGYCLHEIDSRTWSTRIRALNTVTQRDASISDLAIFSVAGGRPEVLLR